MTSAIASMVINALIIVLLAITIGYCWLLNRRIKILQDSRGEMAKLLKHFDESTQRASESIVALQAASKKIGEHIQQRIDKANYLIDDLTYMIEKGNKLANQMEAGFAVGRAQMRVSAASQVRPERETGMEMAATVATVAPAKPAVEAELASKAAAAGEEVDSGGKKIKPYFEQGNFTKYELPKEAASTVAQPPKQTSSVEAMLERVISRSRGANTETESVVADSRAAVKTAKQRTRAEQELLDLIKTGMKG